MINFLSIPPRLLALTSALFLTLSAQALQARVLDCEVNGKSVNPANGNTTAGLSGVMRCVDRESKILQREQELREGRFMGLERFYENGRLAREHTLNERGNKEGLARSFSAGGQVMAEEHYRFGSALGLQKFFYDSGALRRLSFYAQQGKGGEIILPTAKDDLTKVGETKSSDTISTVSPPFIHTQEIASMEFAEDGRLSGLRCGKVALIRFQTPQQTLSDSKHCGFEGLQSTELFSSGRRSERREILNGEVLARDTFYGNGTLRFQSATVASERVERHFSEAGVKLKETGLQVNGQSRTSYERLFHESGALIQETLWAERKIDKLSTWYLNGQLKSLKTYSPERVSTRTYYDSGKPESEVHHDAKSRALLRMGDHRFFDDQGNLRRIVSYDERGRLKREQEFDAAGKTTRDDAVFEDGSRKAFTR